MKLHCSGHLLLVRSRALVTALLPEIKAVEVQHC
jgi:hypothetical protein